MDAWQITRDNGEKMMKEKEVVVRYVFGASFVIVTTGILLFVLKVFLAGPPIGSERKRRVKLLYETNHDELRAACEELSRRVMAGSLRPDMYSLRVDRAPEVAQFPQVILDLKPVAVTLSQDGTVTVVMIGGFDHWGVVFYPDDYKIQTPDGLPLGNKELIDGLWYYDDGYRERSDWQQRLDSLKPRKREN